MFLCTRSGLPEITDPSSPRAFESFSSLVVSLRPPCLTGHRLEAGGLATLKIGFSFLFNCDRAYLSVFHVPFSIMFCCAHESGFS